MSSYRRAKLESIELTDLWILNTFAFILASTVVLDVTMANCFLQCKVKRDKY